MMAVTIYAGWFMCGLMCGFAIHEWGRGEIAKMRRSIVLAASNGTAAIALALLR